MTDTAPKARPGLFALYARRFGRFADDIASGFAPLGYLVERVAKSVYCDHEFKYVKSRSRRVCPHCGASRSA